MNSTIYPIGAQAHVKEVHFSPSRGMVSFYFEDDAAELCEVCGSALVTDERRTAQMATRLRYYGSSEQLDDLIATYQTIRAGMEPSVFTPDAEALASAKAREVFPRGCTCGNNDGGCEYCVEYYNQLDELDPLPTRLARLTARVDRLSAAQVSSGAHGTQGEPATAVKVEPMKHAPLELTCECGHDRAWHLGERACQSFRCGCSNYQQVSSGGVDTLGRLHDQQVSASPPVRTTYAGFDSPARKADGSSQPVQDRTLESCSHCGVVCAGGCVPPLAEVQAIIGREMEKAGG